MAMKQILSFEILVISGSKGRWRLNIISPTTFLLVAMIYAKHIDILSEQVENK